MSNKKNSGITLVAVIITVIILLIITGVSVSVLLGRNGTIKESTVAKDKTNKAYAEECVMTEVSGSYDKFGRINLDELNSNLRKNLENIELKAEDGTYSALTEENRITKLPSTVKYRGYDVEITGEASVTLAEEDDGEDVDPVDPEVNEPEPEKEKLTLEKLDQAITDYSYFSKDDDNYYFIYDEYLAKEKIPTSGNIVTDKTYNVKMNKLDKNAKENFVRWLRGEEPYEGVWDSLEEEIKNNLASQGISKDSLDKMKLTGGPTPKQFEDAYNERYGTNGKLAISGSDSEGYLYNLGWEKDKTTINLSGKEVYNNKLFFPHTGSEQYNGCSGYWLAFAPNYNETVCCLIFTGDLTNRNIGESYVGVRPIFSVPRELIDE